MKRSIHFALLIGLVSCGSYALADDTMSQATPTNHQLMKDCIEKQKTTDVNMSKAEMKRLCKEQLQQQKQSGVPTDPPVADTPKN